MIRLLRKIYERIISGTMQVNAFLSTIAGNLSTINKTVKDTQHHKIKQKVLMIGGSNFFDSEGEFSDFITNQDNQEHFYIDRDNRYYIAKDRIGKNYTDLNHINIGAINKDSGQIITIRINGNSKQDNLSNNILTFYVLPNSVLNKSIDYNIPVTLFKDRSFGEIEVTGINSGSEVNITISHYPFSPT